MDGGGDRGGERGGRGGEGKGGKRRGEGSKERRHIRYQVSEILFNLRNQ